VRVVEPRAPENLSGKPGSQGRRYEKTAEPHDVPETKGDSRGSRKLPKTYTIEIKGLVKRPVGRVRPGKSICKMKVYPYGLLKTKGIKNDVAKIRSYP
jgi:hypothetical protein